MAKAPFKILYSNDCTNVNTCVSPYHRKGQLFEPRMLEATVDEVSDLNVDVHLIQLAHGWVPWYRSRMYPIEEHLAWWEKHFGVDPMQSDPETVSILKYLLDGGDMLKVFIDRCRLRGQTPFLSHRMNDVHFAERAHDPGNLQGLHAISRFYAKHTDWRLGEDYLDNWLSRGLDWSHPEVVEHKLQMITEQCEDYDIDGLELDFLRFPAFFKMDQTTSPQRVNIMTQLINQVRTVLDRTARKGQHRWLCVRIPAYVSWFDRLGIDMKQWHEAGVEMFNLSYSYVTAQNGNLAQIRKQAPDAAMYCEMCHTHQMGPHLTQERVNDAYTIRRVTPTQYYTTAHDAYEQGMDGMSLFNFVYYREHGVPGRGPFDEPPFHILSHLGNRQWLADQIHEYFIPDVAHLFFRNEFQLPRTVKPKETASFTMRLSRRGNGMSRDGRLRVQVRSNLGNENWTAMINGQELQKSSDRDETSAYFYEGLAGGPENHRAWDVASDTLVEGKNHITVTRHDGGTPVVISFMDLTIV